MTDAAEILDPPELTLGERLEVARRRAGLTPAQLADRLREEGVARVSRSTVSAWENNTNRPSDLVDIAVKYEKITRYPAWWLLGLDRHQAKIMKLLPADPGQMELSFAFPPALDIVGCTK